MAPGRVCRSRMERTHLCAASTTQASRAHDALRRPEASYRAILESGKVAISIYDRGPGTVLDATPAR